MSEVEFVREHLRAAKGKWVEIAREAGVSHRAIYNVVYLNKDHRQSTINKLGAYFRAGTPPPSKEAANG